MKKLSQATVNKILVAFDAMIGCTSWGQPHYRTKYGVYQQMPKHIEKKVRDALKALGRRNVHES